MSLSTYVKLTPLSGSPAPLTLPQVDDIERDAVGNVTFSWRDPIRSPQARLTLSELEPYVSKGVQQLKNRLSAYQCLTDPGGVLLQLEWTEPDPWSAAVLGPYFMNGVAALSGVRNSRNQDGLTLIVYLAQYRYERGSGKFEAV